MFYEIVFKFVYFLIGLFFFKCDFQKYFDLVVLLFRAEVLVFPLCDQEINSMSDGPFFILDFYYFILVF